MDWEMAIKWTRRAAPQESWPSKLIRGREAPELSTTLGGHLPWRTTEEKFHFGPRRPSLHHRAPDGRTSRPFSRPSPLVQPYGFQHEFCHVLEPAHPPESTAVWWDAVCQSPTLCHLMFPQRQGAERACIPDPSVSDILISFIALNSKNSSWLSWRTAEN